MDKAGGTEHPAPGTGATGLSPSLVSMGREDWIPCREGGKGERVSVSISRSSPPRGTDQGWLGVGQAWD